MTDAAKEETTSAPPDKEAIRDELEATRKAYHELLASLSPADWKKRSANPSWTVGQLMWHIPWGASFYPQAVEHCRKGKGFNPPQWLANPVNAFYTKFASRSATPESVAKKYDDAHAAILTCLETVQDDEWQKSTTSFNEYHTIESSFHGASEHFREHEADILKGLGRA